MTAAPGGPLKAHLFRLSGQTIVYGLAGASLSLVGLVTLPVFTRAFTPAQYGALEIVVVAGAALTIVVDLGLGLAAQRSYYDYPASETAARRAVVATALATSLACACVAAALAVAFSDQISDLLLGEDGYSTLVAITALTLPAVALAQLTREVMRLTVRPWPFLKSSILTAGIGAGVGIVLVSGGDARLEQVQWGVLLGAASAGLYGLVVVRGDVGRAYSRRELAVMLRFGLPLVPAGLAFWGLALLDRFLLQRLSDLEEVGIYGVANRAASVAFIAVIAFVTAWGPFMLSLHADDAAQERQVRARVLVYVSVLFGLVALVLGLFAREAITIVAPGYEEAADVVGLLALGVACYGVGSVAGAGLTIARRTSALAGYTGLALAVNVALCLALIPAAGQVGAAIATLVGYAVLAALQYRRAQQVDHAPFEAGRIVLALAVCAAPLPLGVILEPGLMTLAIKLLAMVLAIAALFAVGVLGPMERAWLRELTSGRRSAP